VILNLDELEAAVKTMTPGPWDPGDFEDWDEVHRVGLLALVNAAPELIRLTRDNIHLLDGVRALVDAISHDRLCNRCGAALARSAKSVVHGAAPEESLKPELAAARTEIQRLRLALVRIRNGFGSLLGKNLPQAFGSSEESSRAMFIVLCADEIAFDALRANSSFNTSSSAPDQDAPPSSPTSEPSTKR
jgi:hypothetical protein